MARAVTGQQLRRHGMVEARKKFDLLATSRGAHDNYGVQREKAHI